MRIVAFLGGINVGKRRVKMPVLVDVFQKLGHQNVATFIASGNIVFDSNQHNLSAIEMNASQALEQILGYDVSVYSRRFDDLELMANIECFRDEESQGATIQIAFMRHALDAKTASLLESIRTDYDSFRVSGREFFWVCRTKISESKVWCLPAIKQLKLPNCTLRNISTIRKFVAKFSLD